MENLSRLTLRAIEIVNTVDIEDLSNLECRQLKSAWNELHPKDKILICCCSKPDLIKVYQKTYDFFKTYGDN